MLTIQDKEQLSRIGKPVDQVIKEWEQLKKGIPFTKIQSAATTGHGILDIDPKTKEKLVADYHDVCSQKSIVKFIPASGAATRMFQFLYVFLENAEESVSQQDVQANPEYKQLAVFLSNLEVFPFYSQLEEVLEKEGVSKTPYNLVKYLLQEDGLNFGKLPKGVLPFHVFEGKQRTPVFSHLEEGVFYATNGKKVQLHFTISAQHETVFKETVEHEIDQLQQTNLEFEVSFSQQQKHTDTICIDDKNNLVRDETGKLLLRPGGHGALIENLNQINADWVFIKNIDNVARSQWSRDQVLSKKVLAGLLAKMQNRFFKYRLQLDTFLKVEDLKEIEKGIEDFGLLLNPERIGWTLEERCRYLRRYLYRPIRVCGMVKNEGAPGGGPFWVEDKNGDRSLQIVELAQINMANPKQQQIVQQATHFNPVDLVCGLKDYKGESYNLLQYRNPNQGFIAQKHYNGKPIKALELPGLWNGAMANWLTVFVAVPTSSFNPVKNVNDLLKPAHTSHSVLR